MRKGLIIHDCKNVKSLEYITEMEQHLEITNCVGIDEFPYFPKFTEHFHIQNNPFITSLNFMPNLKKHVLIIDCKEFNDMNSLHNIVQQLYLRNLDKIEILSLPFICARLEIFDCKNLRAITDLNNIEMNLNVMSCFKLESICGCPRLENILCILAPHTLTKIGNMPMLTSNVQLTAIGIKNLVSFSKMQTHFKINRCLGLESLEGLQNMRHHLTIMCLFKFISPEPI